MSGESGNSDVQDMTFTVETTEEQGRPVVVMTGELDLGAVPQIDAAVNAMLTEQGPWTIDLRDVVFLDSSVLKSLLRARRYAAERRDDLVLRRPTDARGMKAFEMSALEPLFAFED